MDALLWRGLKASSRKVIMRFLVARSNRQTKKMPLFKLENRPTSWMKNFMDFMDQEFQSTSIFSMILHIGKASQL